MVENVDLGGQDVAIAGPSSAKSPRIANGVLEGLRASLKEEISAEIKGFLPDFERELLKLLKPKTSEIVMKLVKNTLEGERRAFYIPTESVRISSTLNDNTNASRNMVTGILNNSTKQPKNKISKSTSVQRASHNCQVAFRTGQHRQNHVTHAKGTNSVAQNV